MTAAAGREKSHSSSKKTCPPRAGFLVSGGRFCCFRGQPGALPRLSVGGEGELGRRLFSCRVGHARRNGNKKGRGTFSPLPFYLALLRRPACYFGAGPGEKTMLSKLRFRVGLLKSVISLPGKREISLPTVTSVAGIAAQVLLPSFSRQR